MNTGAPLTDEQLQALGGLQSVPLTIAAQIPAAAAAIRAREQALIALCRSPDFTLAKLRAFLARQQP